MAIDTEAKTSFRKRKKEEEGRKEGEGVWKRGRRREEKRDLLFNWLCGFCWIVYIAASSGDTILAGAPFFPSLRVASYDGQ